MRRAKALQQFNNIVGEIGPDLAVKDGIDFDVEAALLLPHTPLVPAMDDDPEN